MADLSAADRALEAFGITELETLHPQVKALLYHYTTSDGMANIIRSGRIWAHNIGMMNDFTEVRLAASVLGAHLDRAYAVEPEPRVCELFRAMRRYLATIELSTVFALSLSDNGEEPGMWRLYAERGTGFSFGIPAFKLRQPWGGYLIKCNYSSIDLDGFCVRALATIRRAYLEDVGAGREGRCEGYAALFFRHVVWFGPVFKHAAWSDEQEWRVVFVRPTKNHRQRADGRTYIEIPAPEDGRLPIGAICAGPSCDYEKSVRPLQALMTEFGYGDVPIHISVHTAGSKR